LAAYQSRSGNRRGPAVRNRRLWRRPTIESLEPRTLLTADFVISEFVADNDNGLIDRYGNASDWIEIHNTGDTAGSLDGYYLTDSATNKTKSQFPNVTVAADGYLVVFASDQDDRDPAQELHTNFALSKGGEYLGLIAPDGNTVLSEYAPTQQFENVSYGVGNVTEPATLVSSGANVSWLVPSSGSLGQSWTQTGFDASSWTSTKQIPNSRIAISEANTNSTAVVEIQNVSGLSQVTAGWRVAVGDSSTDINSVNSTRWQLPNNIVAGSVQYKTDGSTNAWGSNIAWSNTTNGWVMIVDQSGHVVDFVAWGWTAAQIATLNVSFDGLAGITVPTSVWSGDGLSLASNTTTNSYQRIGSSDTNVAANFSRVSPTSNGTRNTGINTSFGSTSAPATTGVGFERDTGYENLLGTTSVDTAMFGINSSIYMRVPFVVQAGQTFASLKLRMRYDDGFVAYLNGTEVARSHAPGTAGTPLAYNAAGSDHPDAQAIVFEDFDISAFRKLLVPGSNVLAIQGLNSSTTSADALILPELVANKITSQSIGYMSAPTPGGVNGTATLGFLAKPTISVSHGFFSSPFQTTISSTDPGVTIRYTTNGATPTATTGTLYTGPVTISGTTTLRTAAFKNGYTTSSLASSTYIFLADVLTQSSATPAGFAANGTNGQSLNYGMDPDIVNSATWGPQMLAALKSIPTISITTDNANLWDPTTGIYVNALLDGQDWERPASVELINPDGTAGFQINAGLRIRGGYSRNDFDPKHAFRLFFNDDYDGELNYALFGNEGVDQFKKIDLRTAQNYSWSSEGDSRMTFLRDIFSRDRMRDMGEPYTRGREYFLYINGQFWGIYQTEERPDADYAASYFGGDDDDYDVVKHNADNGSYTVTATDGNLDAFLQLWDLSNQVAAAPTQSQKYALFMQMQGLNTDGTRKLAYPVLLDAQNLIDYMALILYSGNLDAPISNFIGNVGINNWFGIRNRNGDQGFQFLVHDSEHTMLDVNTNRNGPFGTPDADHANPQWIHQQLMFCDEYRLMFADRVQKLTLTGGALSASAGLARFNARKLEIDSAIIAESARWGDSKHEPPYTKTTWQTAINASITWIQQRTAIVLNQFRNTTLYNNGSLGASAPLYPSLNAQTPLGPVGGNFAGGFALAIFDGSSGGAMYYTLDGSDPRLVGGGIAATAKLYQSPIELPSGTVRVKARYRSASGEWSALYDVTYTQTAVGLRQGDFDRDGARTTADLAAMLRALTNLDDYRASHGGMSPEDLLAIGDLDGDGQLTNRDIQSLLNRLAQESASGSGSASSESPSASQSPSSQNSGAGVFAIDRSTADVALVSSHLADNDKAFGPSSTKPSARPLPSLVNAPLISTNTRPRIVGPIARFDLDQNRRVAAGQTGSSAPEASLTGPRPFPVKSPDFAQRLDSSTRIFGEYAPSVAVQSAVSRLMMAGTRTEHARDECVTDDLVASEWEDFESDWLA
jgi:hypothetical protein